MQTFVNTAPLSLPRVYSGVAAALGLLFLCALFAPLPPELNPRNALRVLMLLYIAGSMSLLGVAGVLLCLRGYPLGSFGLCLLQAVPMLLIGMATGPDQIHLLILVGGGFAASCTLAWLGVPEK